MTAYPGNTLEFKNFVITGYPSPGITYQWYRNDTAIEGSTYTYYVLTEDDVLQEITFKATVSNLFNTKEYEYSFGATVSFPQEYIFPSFILTPTASSINPTIGDSVSVQNFGVTGNPEPVVSFVWYIDGISLSGETLSSYTTSATGDLISVVRATNILGFTGATVDFGTISGGGGTPDPDWDTYEDGIYEFPSTITTTPQSVTVVQAPSSTPEVQKVFVGEATV